MRPRRRCLGWRVIPNYGKQIIFSVKLPKRVAWETPCAQRMSEHISVRPESLSLIRFLVARVPTAQGALIAEGVWWDVVTMPRTHCPKIIFTSPKRMEQR